MEKLADRVKRLTKELDDAREQMARCQHKFSQPVRATRQVQEAIFDHYEGHGSDPEPVYNYYPRTEYGYERKCESCGLVQYTTKTKPVQFGPNFEG